MAENVAFSLHKGQPVVVCGRYYSREYEINETVRVSYELEANVVGHDLSRGTSEFRKTVRPSVAASVDVDHEGIPADHSDAWLDLAEPTEPARPVGPVAPAATDGVADGRELASVS
jgi:single-strand DNA-binding protein